VAAAGLEPHYGVNGTQVIDFAFSSISQNLAFPEAMVQKWYKIFFPQGPRFPRRIEISAMMIHGQMSVF
jgi:hypothetical protein